VKSKTYTQNKQPSDKTQSSKFGQLGVQNRKKNGNDFFDRSTTLMPVFLSARTVNMVIFWAEQFRWPMM